MKRYLSITVRLVISVLLMVLVLRKHDFQAEILPRLGELIKNWPWALAGLAAAGLTLVFAAMRWWVIMRGFAPHVPLSALVKAEIVATFFNIASIGPVGGDAYKILALTKRLKGDATRVSVSLMLDHVAGFVAVGLMFFLCLSLIWPRWTALGHDARLLVGGYAYYMGFSLAALLLSWVSFMPKTLAWGRRTFPRLLGAPWFKKLENVNVVLSTLWTRALLAVGVAVFLYLSLFSSFYCALRAVGGSAPFLDVLTAMPVVDAAASLPISVSGIGVRERTFEAMLSGFAQVPEVVCISAAMVGWLFTVTWGLLGGLLFLRGKEAAA